MFIIIPNFSNEDTRVFVKLVSKGENYVSTDRIFFFDENRENLFYQETKENNTNTQIQYKFDYIFSHYDNTMLISRSINLMLANLIENEKNVLFITFGENNLGATKFFLGSNQGNLLNNESFFSFAYQTILQTMNKNYQYDNILIEIYKIANEKFIVDYVKINFL